MEAVQELLDALVDEGVMGDVIGPLVQLRSAGQVAAQDQVGSLQIIALLGQLLDWIAAVAQDADVAIDESDAAVAQRRIVERRVVTHQAEIAPVGLDLAQVQSADGAIFDGEFVLLARAVVGDAERLPARARGLVGGDRWRWLHRIHRWEPPGVGVGQPSMYTNCAPCGKCIGPTAPSAGRRPFSTSNLAGLADRRPATGGLETISTERHRIP